MSDLDQLMEEVRQSAKYRSVCEPVIRRVGERELRAHRYKDAVKAAKNKLHQIAGAYLPGKMEYARWEREVAEAYTTGDPTTLRETLTRIMRHHASTRERLTILETFYITTLVEIEPIRSVLDIGCGLNPLAIPWMPLAEGATYLACDLYHDLAEFHQKCFNLLGVQGEARACDAFNDPPTEEVDLALLLKVLPPMEQMEKGSSLRLMRELRARTLLVSFPSQSLGGRHKGMPANYEAAFRDMISEEPWEVERFEFENELAFRVRKALRPFPPP